MEYGPCIFLQLVTVRRLAVSQLFGLHVGCPCGRACQTSTPGFNPRSWWANSELVTDMLLVALEKAARKPGDV